VSLGGGARWQPRAKPPAPPLGEGDAGDITNQLARAIMMRRHQTREDVTSDPETSPVGASAFC